MDLGMASLGENINQSMLWNEGGYDFHSKSGKGFKTRHLAKRSHTSMACARESLGFSKSYLGLLSKKAKK